MHERTKSSGARLIVRLTSLAMESRFAPTRWEEWMSEDELDMSSAGFIATDKKIKSDHAMAEVSEDAASSAASATIDQKCKYDHATAEVGSDEVLGPVASQDCSSGSDAHLCSRWLQEVGSLLSAYDAKLLQRYIPVLPPDSLQKVITVSHSEQAAYLAGNRQQTQQRSAEKNISKMAMRRVLGTTFARLALTDFLILEMHRQWEATTNRSHRKGQQSAKQHTQQWHQRGQHGRG